MTFEEIRPMSLYIIHHPLFKQWENNSYVKQLDDGLWLHYTVVCTLLREAENRGKSV